MLFNGYAFLAAFLPATLAGFFVLRRQTWRLAFVVVASYVFYASDALWFPPCGEHAFSHDDGGQPNVPCGRKIRRLLDRAARAVPPPD